MQFPISEFVWNLLPKLRFLQFPWRWLVVLQAPMAIFFASAIWINRPRWRWLVVGACAGLFLGATGFAAFNFFQNCDEEDAVWAMIDTYYTHTGFPGTDEYVPPFADNSQLAMGLPDACLTASPTAVLGQGDPGANLQWTPDQGSCLAAFSRAETPGKAPEEHFRVEADLKQSGYLILRLRSYPAWFIKFNGQPVTQLPERGDGLIAIPVPQGHVEVTADWTTTSDVVISRWLTALALLLVTALCVLERRWRTTRLS